VLFEVEALEGPLALWSLFGSAFVSATLAPGGSEAVLAYLAHKAAHPPLVLLAAATSGNTLGAVTTWLLGYWVGFRYPVDRPEDPRRHRAVVSVRRWGIPILLLSWLPVVGDGFCFAAGWLRLPFWASVLAIGVGKALRYAAILYAFV
jgi:membrane protein YqaA with SNARE-associated domain